MVIECLIVEPDILFATLSKPRKMLKMNFMIVIMHLSRTVEEDPSIGPCCVLCAV